MKKKEGGEGVFWCKTVGEWLVKVSKETWRWFHGGGW